ncbi:MAG: transcriptional regulator [Burkholderiaceae bacterium]|jgi:CRP/FNR family transcriptional regulator, anaerobic regulatory protein|uniref:Cyclic nucleotide-binding domain-containing protein n=1 Tax=Cupriavidus metallidurans TaxID=119219 RepID=A0A482IXI4_9BURK|nr:MULTISPECIES: helix-turn-helix domain-containing protein [Cupriavidus]KWR78500.1 transcriptional regulator [Cupriavidus sp. SHE]PCH54681.1 MAG: transcriptional regulator [Burkholderiaceae bacterium]QBP11654.1 cyclic nucleotide-binding domain-containing protein [Cupriavidus metallidurans]QWC90234.1 helix-turn-helix domain-containing protein [Cupriavidus metallidurans]
MPRCSACTFASFCLPGGLNRRDIDRLDSVVHGRISLHKGESLYRLGDPVKSIYAIRVGTLKSQVSTQDGRVQIVGFHLPGELVGLDSLVSPQYMSHAVALEDARLCRINLTALRDLAVALPGLYNNILRLMANEVRHDHGMLRTLGVLNAEERLIAFLLSLSARLSARGFAASEFQLRMTREEIGSYLGLKLETISRLFSRLSETGLITVRHRSVKLNDLNGLRLIYEGSSGALASFQNDCLTN